MGAPASNQSPVRVTKSKIFYDRLMLKKGRTKQSNDRHFFSTSCFFQAFMVIEIAKQKGKKMKTEKQYDHKTQWLYNLIATDWKTVQDATALKHRLKISALILEELGHTELSADWLARIENAPATMNKEAINQVLMAATLELEKAGVI
jgi:hypothetical protein